MKTLLTPTEERRERVRTMCRVFQRVNRTLSGQEIVCKDVDDIYNPAPAWGDGKTISFNVAQIGDVTSVDDLIKLNGLNYHELSHVLYTPRQTTSLSRRIVAAGLFPFWNILEDQRIETLFTGMYPSTKPYLTTTFMSYIANEPSKWDEVFPLTWGRAFLPLNLREEFGRRYQDPSAVQDMKDVIDEYRFLAFPRDYDLAFDLTQKFADLLNHNAPDADPFGHASRPTQAPPSQGSPVSVDDQDSASSWAEFAESEDADDDSDGASGSGKGDSDSDSDGDDDSSGSGGDGDEQNDSDNDGEGGTPGKPSDADGDDSASSTGAATAGKGKAKPSTHTTFDSKSFQDALNAAANAAKEDHDVQRDIAAKQNTIVKGDGHAPASVPASSFAAVDAPADAVLSVKRVSNELRRLVNDLDPGFRTHQPSGRLNVQRAMHGVDPETAFDVWESGKHSATDIEMVIGLDLSSSMQGMMQQASIAMWMMKRAVETLGVDAHVTVYGFNYEAFVLYRRDERAGATQFRNFKAQGGTKADDMLLEARRVFSASRSSNKILLMISDGHWDGELDRTKPTGSLPWVNLNLMANTHIEAMNAAGITTAVAHLDDGSLAQWKATFHNPQQQADVDASVRHSAQVFATVNAPSDLIPFTKALVKNVMKGGK